MIPLICGIYNVDPFNVNKNTEEERRELNRIIVITIEEKRGVSFRDIIL